jgi:hypothetical protein
MPKNGIHSYRIKKEETTEIWSKKMYLIGGRGRYCWSVESGNCCVPKWNNTGLPLRRQTKRNIHRVFIHLLVKREGVCKIEGENCHALKWDKIYIAFRMKTREMFHAQNRCTC